MKNPLSYRVNGAGAILIAIIAVNAVITYFVVNFFVALLQLFALFCIAFLGNRTTIEREKNDLS